MKWLVRTLAVLAVVMVMAIAGLGTYQYTAFTIKVQNLTEFLESIDDNQAEFDKKAILNEVEHFKPFSIEDNKKLDQYMNMTYPINRRK